MIILKTVWVLLQIIIGYNLLIPVLLYLIFLLTRKKIIVAAKEPESDYAIIVTAYQQTDMLHSVIASILNLNYSKYLVYVVADNCDISTLYFDSDKVILLRPEEVLAGNTRSHFYAIKNFKRWHKRLTIIDSDNVVHPEYLNKLDVYFNQGYCAVQGFRAAKNLNSTYACLDGARDIYYHFYDGKVLFNVGSSATLAGSGMAFTTQLYIDCLLRRDINGAGFDKVLQYEILKKGFRIAFAEDAIVYDEKTTNANQLVKQRSRWINTWFRYFKFGFFLLGKGFKGFNVNLFLFGLILLRPPLFIFLISSLVFLIADLQFSPVTSLIWLAGLVLFVLGFFIALLESDTEEKIYSSLINIPKFMFYQVLSLLKIRKANQYSVATEHTYTKSIEQL